MFEVDVDALQSLLNTLYSVDQGIDYVRGPLITLSNNFESSFISPNKGNYETNFNDLVTYFNAAQARVEELRASLNNLLAITQQAEQVAF